jgi:hypothetical protein
MDRDLLNRVACGGTTGKTDYQEAFRLSKRIF